MKKILVNHFKIIMQNGRDAQGSRLTNVTYSNYNDIPSSTSSVSIWTFLSLFSGDEAVIELFILQVFQSIAVDMSKFSSSNGKCVAVVAVELAGVGDKVV